MESGDRSGFVFPRPLPYVLAFAVVVSGAVWLANSALSPHTASSVVELEADRSTLDPTRPIRLIYVNPFDSALGPLSEVLRSDDVALRLATMYPEAGIDLEFIAEGTDVDADMDDHWIRISFTDSRRALARDVVSVIVAEYRLALELAEVRAAEVGSLHWDITSIGGVEFRGVQTPVMFLLLGMAGIAFLIPRRWWADRVVWNELSVDEQRILVGGIIGLAVFLTPDLFGYGFPGFGSLQRIGTAFSLAAIALAAEGLPTLNPGEAMEPPRSSDPAEVE